MAAFPASLQIDRVLSSALLCDRRQQTHEHLSAFQCVWMDCAEARIGGGMSFQSQERSAQVHFSVYENSTATFILNIKSRGQNGPRGKQRTTYPWVGPLISKAHICSWRDHQSSSTATARFQGHVHRCRSMHYYMAFE